MSEPITFEFVGAVREINQFMPRYGREYSTAKLVLFDNDGTEGEMEIPTTGRHELLNHCGSYRVTITLQKIEK